MSPCTDTHVGRPHCRRCGHGDPRATAPPSFQTVNPLPGMFFLRHVQGWRGRAISAMQAFVRGGSYWTHAGLIVDGGWFVQGQPGGAAVYPVGDLFDGRPVVISDAPIQRAIADLAEPERGAREIELRNAVAHQGRLLVHTEYSYLDYVALGAVEFHWPGYRLLADYVQHTGHLICSALVDKAYAAAGVQLFDDGYPPGDVTPQDLADYDAAWRGVPRSARKSRMQVAS